MPVRIPASTSNLGAGFDCVGVAIARWLDARVEVDGERVDDGAPEVSIARGGTLGALDAVPPHADHLFRGFALACARAGVLLPARVAFEARSDIPVARGLGSSAAALVAGAALAVEALALPLAPADVAAIAAAQEGHGDNAGPCTLGGAVLAIDRGAAHADRFAFRRLALHPDVALVFAVPDFVLETRAMRAALPPTLPYATGVAAASNASTTSATNAPASMPSARQLSCIADATTGATPRDVMATSEEPAPLSVAPKAPACTAARHTSSYPRTSARR